MSESGARLQVPQRGVTKGKSPKRSSKDACEKTPKTLDQDLAGMPTLQAVENKVASGETGSCSRGSADDGEESEYEVEIEEEGLLDPDDEVVELLCEHGRKSTWDTASLNRLKEEELGGGASTSLQPRRSINQSPQQNKGFTRFQAILTDLPKHALQSPEASSMRSCGSCGVPGPSTLIPSSSEAPPLSCACVVEMALVQAIQKYPQYAQELARLIVAHASPDIAMFVDHEKQCIFTSIRGTCPTSARDLGNDALIVFGVTPARVYYVRHTYASVRQLYPTYKSYGCGHSLGGSIMHDLAHGLEEEPELRFERVDVFNAGGSPFRKNYSALHYTEFNAHRVAGDFVSYFYQPPGGDKNSRGGRTIQHDLNPNFMAHGLGHFLPRRRTTLGRFMSRGFNVMWGGWLSCSCSGRTPSIR